MVVTYISPLQPRQVVRVVAMTPGAAAVMLAPAAAAMTVRAMSAQAR